MSSELVYRHYSNEDVQETIMEYCRSRWVALEGSALNGKIFVRYLAGKPLTICSRHEVDYLLNRYRRLNVRTFYASINIYNELKNPHLLNDPKNIVGATPFWDIDANLEKWMYAVKAAREICQFLRGEGVSESVYLLWSGEGIHVRIHEEAFSPKIRLKYNPLNIAFSITEYVIRKLEDKLRDIIRESEGIVKIENLIDVKRVFTVPLSLHRKHDLVAVVINPSELDNFDISWARVENYRSSNVWKKYVEGEADNFAEKAINTMGKAILNRTSIKTEEIIEPQIKPKKIPRFQVMALLQAARYYLLTGDIEKAKSFGLNRAIFYAYLKHYGRIHAKEKGDGKIKKRTGEMRKMGGYELPIEDGVEISDRGLFMIGGKEQTEKDFERDIIRRVETLAPFEMIWESAIKYLSKYSKEILVNPQEFYKHVYEPVRDKFMEKIIEEAEIQEKTRGEGMEKESESRVNGRKPKPSIKQQGLLKWI